MAAKQTDYCVIFLFFHEFLHSFFLVFVLKHCDRQLLDLSLCTVTYIVEKTWHFCSKWSHYSKNILDLLSFRAKKILLQAFSAAISNQTLFSYSLEVIQFVRNLIIFYCLLHPNATYVCKTLCFQTSLWNSADSYFADEWLIREVEFIKSFGAEIKKLQLSSGTCHGAAHKGVFFKIYSNDNLVTLIIITGQNLVESHLCAAVSAYFTQSLVSMYVPCTLYSSSSSHALSNISLTNWWFPVLP